MATVAGVRPLDDGGGLFFRRIALVMGVVTILGFATQLGMGRSTFAAPVLTHIHAAAFMGWVALFMLQPRLATIGPVELHRKLGWIGAGLAGLLVVLGCALVADVVQRGTTPFFFRPQYFLIANPLTVFIFAGLTFAAIRLRRSTDWHQRLHICGMAAIIGPAFGRLLPMPLLIPHSFDIALLAGLAFPAAGMVRDWRADGRVHQAWLWGIGGLLAMLPLAHLIAYSPLGDAIYRGVTAGHPGATVPGLAFGAPPGSALVTGRGG